MAFSKPSRDFSLEDVEKLAQATGGNEKAQVIDLAKLPPEVNAEQVLQDHRLLVFFFDLSSMQPDELMRALKASSDFVTNRMTPADLIAVVTYSSSLRVTQDFTNNRDSLRKALRAILVGEESSTLAATGTIGEAGGTDANGMEIVTQDVSDAFTPDETEFNIFNTDEKLAAIESLATMLRSVPGRKSVIHFSSGITRTGQENQAHVAGGHRRGESSRCFALHHGRARACRPAPRRRCQLFQPLRHGHLFRLGRGVAGFLLAGQPRNPGRPRHRHGGKNLLRSERFHPRLRRSSEGEFQLLPDRIFTHQHARRMAASGTFAWKCPGRA